MKYHTFENSHARISRTGTDMYLVVPGSSMHLEPLPSILDPGGEVEPPLTVIPMFSGGASGARFCETHDDRFGRAYRFPVAISTDADAPGIDRLDAPVEVHDVHDFYERRDADITDLDVRSEYEADLRQRLDPHDPDLLVLSGYMYVVTETLLGTYPIVNVHPADLRITVGGERAYTGMDAVHDAIVAGEGATRSSVHLVTEGVDEGPLLVVSRPAPVHRPMVTELDGERLRTYVDLHQEWMKDRCDGPALCTALHLLADGKVDARGDGLVVDGTRGPQVMRPPDPFT